jgi:hypothetical protein
MRRLTSLAIISSGFTAALFVASGDAQAARASCSLKSAHGTGISENNAKFQVYEELLKAADWNVWAAWMVDGSTPGYAVKPVKYVCRTGSGLGVTCTGRARICKL